PPACPSRASGSASCPRTSRPCSRAGGRGRTGRPPRWSPWGCRCCRAWPSRRSSWRAPAASGPAATTTGAEPSTPASTRHHERKPATSRRTADAGSSAPKGGSKASNPTLKKLSKLSKLSPKDYQKQSQKLPKTLRTGGKPPPKDDKKPAGGGGFQSIG